MEYEAFVDPETAFVNISQKWKKQDDENKLSNYVVGISGGVDSTCAAALAAKIFGKSNVIGVSLPCDGQNDMSDVDAGYRTDDLRLALANVNKKYTIKLYDDRDTWEPILSKIRAMIEVL